MEAARPAEGCPVIGIVSFPSYFIGQHNHRSFQILGGGETDPISSPQVVGHRADEQTGWDLFGGGSSGGQSDPWGGGVLGWYSEQSQSRLLTRLFSSFTSRTCSWESVFCSWLCPTGHCVLGFPGPGPSKIVWPELPAHGELSGRSGR